jgi:3-oxoacyl-(acyl-carrier-protein) synthase
VPPTLFLEKLDPECDIDVTPRSPKKRTIRHALSINSGFGGKNAAVIFSR